MKDFKNQRGALDIAILVLVIGLIAVAGASIYYKHQTQLAADKAKQAGQSSQTIVKKGELRPANDPYAGWKTFTSKAEGFSLRYPADWKVNDTSSGNCGHVEVNGTSCRERFEFESPTEGVSVMYAVHRDDKNDKISCGTQSQCATDSVKTVQTLSIPGLGKVLYVEVSSNNFADTPGIYLDAPLAAATTPKVGANGFSDYQIDYSLNAKSAGRFVLALRPMAGNTDMVGDKFFSSSAVKQGELILKSLAY